MKEHYVMDGGDGPLWFSCEFANYPGSFGNAKNVFGTGGRRADLRHSALWEKTQVLLDNRRCDLEGLKPEPYGV